VIVKYIVMFDGCFLLSDGEYCTFIWVESHKHGIQTHTLNWIRAFLTDRIQTVVIDGETSNTVPVTSCVPQGTVLCPILFLLYINDFTEYLTHSKLRLFADDSIIIPCCKSYKRLLESRCFIMLLVIICFISLQQVHVSDIGR
jgi:hypothetical protein